MVGMGALLSDISSNARIKLYPGQSVLQVANAPIFRERGYEPRQRPWAVPSKGHAADPLRSTEASMRRARAAILDIALCNGFRYFFTWTLAPELVDRYDREAVKRKVLTQLKNLSYRKGFIYLLVPELHKDGAIHMHGLCTPGQVCLERAVNPHTGLPLSTNRGQPIFNMLDWPLGYSTCIPIDENYEAACYYMVKYLSKDTQKIFGKWYYSSRCLTKRPPVALLHDMDYDQFLTDNPQAASFPLFRDVRMAAMKIPGGVAL